LLLLELVVPKKSSAACHGPPALVLASYLAFTVKLLAVLICHRV